MLKKIRKGPEGWTKLARSFVVRWLQPLLRPKPRPDKAATGPPEVDTRGALRRGLSALKAAAKRRVKRARKGLWELTKWAVAWRHIPLKRSWREVEGSGLVSLHQRLYQPNVKAIRKEIGATQRSSMMLGFGVRPVILGPWLSEIGFEALYWIPFLRWAVAYAEIEPERLWVVSRGGPAGWYEGITDNYLELFDRFSPEAFRDGNEARLAEQGGLKHTAVSAFDREILEWVGETLGEKRCKLLHPSRMYGLFQHYWRKQASIRLIENFTFFRPLAGREAEPVAGLPDEYVAVKFYDNLALPDSEAARAFARGFLAGLDGLPVVSLGTPFRADDHGELGGSPGSGVIEAAPLMSAADNLALQTRIIANARAYYGTYGGFSYLAPLCGTPATVFFSDAAGFRIDHLEVARRVFDVLNCPSYLPVHIRDFERYREDLGTGDAA